MLIKFPFRKSFDELNTNDIKNEDVPLTMKKRSTRFLSQPDDILSKEEERLLKESYEHEKKGWFVSIEDVEQRLRTCATRSISTASRKSS